MRPWHGCSSGARRRRGTGGSTGPSKRFLNGTWPRRCPAAPSITPLSPTWSLPHLAAHARALSGGLVALASCRLVDEGAAELGILIEDAWQRKGLGTRLVRELVAHASDVGLRVLEAQLLAEQAWITSLLRPHGTCRLRSTGNGVLNVTVRLEPTRPST